MTSAFRAQFDLGQVSLLGLLDVQNELFRARLDATDAYPSHLSGGQQQRVAIARALEMEPQIMLFDEATSALPPELVGEALKTIKELADDGMTMMIVTHELGFAYTVANRVLFLSEGIILEQGEPEAVLIHPQEEPTIFFKGPWLISTA